ncbi:Chlorophyllase [Chryseobacterium rhizoplanae]|uniref:Chlorophyllase n=1 Tax=Chryseobacterium rhizoplanae TaxID=1609531 RepID=A0A521DVS6_9FLAO|nr:adenylate cyclase [Chryseobacterium rhizoplanae]SMO75211.1 Chlorophyllase [Chryseobacterium rhizoplanae]
MKKFTLMAAASLLLMVSCQREDSPGTEAQPQSAVMEKNIKLLIDPNDINMFGGKPIENLPAKPESENNLNAKSSVFSTGLANSEFGKSGPYGVSTDDVLGDCDSYFGTIVPIAQALGIVVDNSIKCNNNFPYGLNTDVFSSHIYYPTNIKNMGKLPVVNFVGGIMANTAMYSQMASLWASNGYIVIVSSDFVNVLPTMHLLAFKELSNMNKNQQSPLYGKVDLSRSLISGHSAGGGTTLLTGSISANTFKVIDPEIKILGAMSIEGSPIAIGLTVKVPTLFLAGMQDVIVPPFVHKLWQYDTLPQPAWTATATTATHFSPLMETSRNEFAGLTVAWHKYLAENDPSAKSYFVGKNYKLEQDTQFVQGGVLGLNPFKVNRNRKAEELK